MINKNRFVKLLLLKTIEACKRALPMTLLVVLASTCVYAEDLDNSLYKSILGKWKYIEGSCLSGTLINWPPDLDPKQTIINIEFNSDLTWKRKIVKKGNLWIIQEGSFSINQSILYTRITKSCWDLDSTEGICVETDSPVSQLELISLQGQQIWLLAPQGVRSALCPEKDLILQKLGRSIF